MAKYIFIYKAKTDWSNVPKEEILKVMQVWGEWLGSMGTAVIDKGEAFKAGGQQISSDGVSKAEDLLSGYSIIDAENYDKALELAQGSPAIGRGGKVEVYEAFGM